MFRNSNCFMLLSYLSNLMVSDSSHVMRQIK